MKAFMDKEFMLQSPVAQHLYHTYAADMPICDYHCHISPKEIYENRRFENIAQVWLGGRQPDGSLAGDHYKWRVMKTPYEVYLNGLDAQEIANIKDVQTKLGKYCGLMIGSLETANNNAGNWE